MPCHSKQSIDLIARDDVGTVSVTGAVVRKPHHDILLIPLDGRMGLAPHHTRKSEALFRSRTMRG